MAGIALSDRVDLISIMVPLEVIAKEKNIYMYIDIILEITMVERKGKSKINE